jgi:hypothetical protein
MKTVVAILASAMSAALLGCSSQPVPPQASSSSAAAAQSAPLEEPFPSILTRWNYYRAAAGVPPIVDEAELNEAALHHAKYLVRNHLEWGDAIMRDGRMIETGWNGSAHYESVGNSWYTADGADWAGAATIIRGAAIPLDGASLVDGQAERLDSTAVINPQLAAVGFGRYCAGQDCAGVVVYRQGLDKSQFLALYEGNAMDWNSKLGSMPFTRARLRKPIEFPSNGIRFPSGAERAGECPDPISSRAGFARPIGVPIILELGAPVSGDEVTVASSSISDGAEQIETCTFDATTYANPDGLQQTLARRMLHYGGIVAVIPKNPLQPGHQYNVNIVADSQTYAWSFSIAPAAK